MSYRVVIVAAGLMLSVLAAAAQERPATGYRAPRTPDGYPDLQGFWTNLTYTPFERPRELANKPFYTEEEAIDFFNRSIAGSQDQIVHYVNGDFGATPVQTGARPNRLTSLVVDPADGRIPPLTPEAQKRQQALLAATRHAGLSPRPGAMTAAPCGASSTIAPFRPSSPPTAATITSSSRRTGS
jgi:hypothetical protein